MNPLDIELQAGKSYTSVGNSLSRFFMVWSSLEKHKNILIYTEDQRSLKDYQRLATYWNVPCFELNHQYELSYLESGTPGIYLKDIEESEKTISAGKNHEFKVGSNQSMSQDISDLTDLGYQFQEHGGKGTYRRQGDTLHISDFSGYFSYSISYWGDEIESIMKQTLKGDVVMKSEQITAAQLGSSALLIDDTSKQTLLEATSKLKSLTILDTIEFYSGYQNILSTLPHVLSFDIVGDNQRQKKSLEIDELSLETLEGLKQELEKKDYWVHVYTKRTKLITDFLEYNQIPNVQVHEVQTHILRSFQKHNSTSGHKGVTVICDDILSKVFIKKRVKKKLSQDIDLLLKIKKGDYIIHIDHGIGVFHEIIKKQLGPIEKEYVELHYKENDKLFVPITEVSRISKYVGVENPSLTPLSGKVWEKKMSKIQADIQHIAQELLTTFAERKMRPGIPFVRDAEKMNTFQQKFPYTYTGCQEDSIEEILTDMEQETVMDRLLVGDVGFGKTEIAFNAIYNAICNGKQVAFIAPLVVLAYEHYEKALERFTDLGVNIHILTRMEPQRKVTQTLRGLENGTVDLVIGTHRVLGKSLRFKKLGLIVIDEEHKFGVTDKEKIKSLKTDIDILSMSATPIPRSLNMALSGIRDISVLKTAPEGRQNIATYISPYEEKVILDAGKKEFARAGQVFFVHNRVVNIEVYKKNIQKLFPTKKIVITHGQLPGDELENRIMDFKHKKYDILLSTTVIENGIDFSNVNTIFINECQSFGISQLHQLRGRVGRSDAKGYCYLLYKQNTLSNESAKRLQTVVNYSYLGAGFELAMKDLEIRGGGDILGIRQSGQAKEIGVSLFLKMLEEKIQDLKAERANKPRKRNISPTIDLQISAGIPESFFQSETDKIQFYREIESLESLEELESIIQDFRSVNEDAPAETLNLFQVLRAKIEAQRYGITSIKRVGVNYQVDFRETTTLDELKSFLALDKEVYFHVVDVHRLRAATKVFENDVKFLQYLLLMFEKRVKNPKIRLKK